MAQRNVNPQHHMLKTQLEELQKYAGRLVWDLQILGYPPYDDVWLLMHCIEQSGHLLEHVPAFTGEYVSFPIAEKLRDAEHRITELERIRWKESHQTSASRIQYNKYEHESEMKKLQKTLEKVQCKNESLTNELASIKKEFAEVKKDKEANDDYIEGLKDTFIRLEKSENENKEVLQSEKKKLDKAKWEAETLRTQLADRDNNIEEFRVRIAELEQDREVKDLEIACLKDGFSSFEKEENENLQKKIEQLRYESNQGNLLFSSIGNNKCCDHEQSIQNMQKELESKENDIAESEQEILIIKREKDGETQLRFEEHNERKNVEKTLTEENCGLHERIIELEKILAERNQDIQRAESERQKHISQESGFARTQIKGRKLSQDRNRNEYDETVSELLKSIDSKDREISKLKNQVEQLQERLSKEMSLKLRDQNPMIVDLNDPMNSSKLAVKFGALYDDQWTRIFEECTGDEENIIGKLKTELLECYRFCEERCNGQVLEIISILLGEKRHPYSDDPLSKMSPRDASVCRDKVSECRRFLSSTIVHFLTEKYMNQSTLLCYARTSELSILKEYIAKCMELCWYMCISDPPMVLHIEDTNDNNIYYTTYTTSGRRINYVVWPALLIQKDGKILSKGVAEFLKY